MAFLYRRLFLVSLAVIVLDQLTKYLVLLFIPPNTYFFPGPVPVINNFFYLVHIYNTGAAWGQFSGFNFFLAFLALFALLIIYLFRRSLDLYTPQMQLTFGLLTGGIVGNLIDRIFRFHVVDFLDFHLPGYRWPAFNIADIAIFLGVAFYLFYHFIHPTFSKR